MTESEAYRKYFQPFVQRGDLDTSPTMLLGAMTSGACRGGWGRVAGWLGQLGQAHAAVVALLQPGARSNLPSMQPNHRLLAERAADLPLSAPALAPAPQARRRCCSGWVW